MSCRGGLSSILPRSSSTSSQTSEDPEGSHRGQIISELEKEMSRMKVRLVCRI